MKLGGSSESLTGVVRYMFRHICCNRFQKTNESDGMNNFFFVIYFLLLFNGPTYMDLNNDKNKTT